MPGQVHLSAGAPLTTYYPVPVSLIIDGTVFPKVPQVIEPASPTRFDANFFAQLEWHNKRLHLIGGGALNAASGPRFSLAPRLGILYKIDSTWSVRTNASSGFKQASVYGIANSYQIIPGAGLDITSGAREFNTEQFYASEAGIRFHKGGYRAELTGFWQQAHHLYRPGYLVDEPGFVPSPSYGYKNTPGLAHSIWGVQAWFKRESKELFVVEKFRKKARYRAKQNFTFNIPVEKNGLATVCPVPTKCSISPNGRRSFAPFSRSIKTWRS